MNDIAPFPAASQYLLAQFDCLNCFASLPVISAETREEGKELLASVIAHCFEAPENDPRVTGCAESLWLALEAFAREHASDADDARMRLVGDALAAHFPDGVVTFPLE